MGLEFLLRDLTIVQEQHTLDATLLSQEQARELIEKFPTAQVTDQQVDEGEECSICLVAYKAEESVCQLPCKHCFHNNCLKLWIQNKRTCPVCRHNIQQTIN